MSGRRGRAARALSPPCSQARPSPAERVRCPPAPRAAGASPEPRGAGGAMRQSAPGGGPCCPRPLPRRHGKNPPTNKQTKPAEIHPKSGSLRLRASAGSEEKKIVIINESALRRAGGSAAGRAQPCPGPLLPGLTPSPAGGQRKFCGIGKMQAGPGARRRVRGARKYIVKPRWSPLVGEGENKKRPEWMPGAARAPGCVHPARSCGRGLLPLCAEFLMQPVARMCLIP